MAPVSRNSKLSLRANALAALLLPAPAGPSIVIIMRIEDRGSRIEDRGSRIEDRGSKKVIVRRPRSSILDPRISARKDADRERLVRGQLADQSFGLHAEHLVDE